MTEKPTGELTVTDAGNVLRGAVHAEYRLKTRLIDIFVTLPDPTLATDVANAYAEEYIHYGFDQRAEMNKDASKYLIEESERLNHELKGVRGGDAEFPPSAPAAASFDTMITRRAEQDQRTEQEPQRHREQEPAARR